MHTVKTFRSRDGLMLAYRDYPVASEVSGKSTVLCLAGMTRNAKDFDALAPWINGFGHRVLCPDYRGRGLSEYDPDAANYRPEVYLDDIRHLLIVAGVHRVTVVGTSLGGLLAMGMSAATPTLLAGAVLNDIGPEIHMGDLNSVDGYIGSDPKFSSWSQAVDHIKKWFPDFPAISDEEWEVIAKCGYQQQPDGTIVFDFDPAIGAVLRDPTSPAVVNVWPLFTGLRQFPLASIRGAKSDLFPAKLMDRMAAEHTGLLQATVPNVGHAPSLNEPESRDTIRELLSNAG